MNAFADTYALLVTWQQAHGLDNKSAFDLSLKFSEVWRLAVSVSQEDFNITLRSTVRISKSKILCII